MPRLQPYLNFEGNAQEAMDFYRTVFGGEVSSVVPFREFPIEGVTISDEEQDRLMHIALPIGDDEVLMASDTLPSLGQKLVQGNNAYITIVPADRDEADRIFAGLSAGGEVEMPIADQAWGDYFGSFKDKFGVMWMVNYSPPREQ